MTIISCSSSSTLKSYITEVFELLNAQNKLKAAGTVVAIIISCQIIYFIGAYVSHAWNWRREKKVQPVFTRSMSIGVLHGGDLALQRLVEYHDTRANRASVDVAESELQSLLEKKRPHFKKLQSIVAKLEMCGKESIAVKKLEAALKKCRSDGKSHEAYEIEMLLVEALIYKGDFEKALKYQCLYDESISDARRPFYKAVLYILLDHPSDEAKKCWTEFKEIRRRFDWASALQEKRVIGVVNNFTTFENFVKVLKDDVHNATKNVKN